MAINNSTRRRRTSTNSAENSVAENLELNKAVAKELEARIYGISDTVLNDSDIELYTAKGFKLQCKPFPSTKGDLYYNIAIYDTTVAEGEKNEVARIRVASVIQGEATVDNRFSMFLAQIRRELNDYVIEKQQNYWGRAAKVKQERFNLDDIKVG